MNAVEPTPDAEELSFRAKSVAQADAIWALDGFEKTALSEALDRAYVSGRISLERRGQIVDMSGKLASAQAVLGKLAADDPRRETIAAELAEQRASLVRLAETVGPYLVTSVLDR